MADKIPAAYTIVGNKIIINPTSNLDYNKEYKIVVSTGVKDTYGDELNALDDSNNFTTEAISSTPTLLSYSNVGGISSYLSQLISDGDKIYNSLNNPSSPTAEPYNLQGDVVTDSSGSIYYLNYIDNYTQRLYKLNIEGVLTYLDLDMQISPTQFEYADEMDVEVDAHYTMFLDNQGSNIIITITSNVLIIYYDEYYDEEYDEYSWVEVDSEEYTDICIRKISISSFSSIYSKDDSFIGTGYDYEEFMFNDDLYLHNLKITGTNEEVILVHMEYFPICVQYSSTEILGVVLEGGKTKIAILDADINVISSATSDTLNVMPINGSIEVTDTHIYIVGKEHTVKIAKEDISTPSNWESVNVGLSGTSTQYIFTEEYIYTKSYRISKSDLSFTTGKTTTDDSLCEYTESGTVVAIYKFPTRNY